MKAILLIAAKRSLGWLFPLLLVVPAFVELGASPAFAQVDTFIAGSGNWSVLGNWSLDQIPSSSNDCIIPSGSAVVADTGGACNNLSVGTGTSLTVTPGYVDVFATSIVNNGSITVGNGDGLAILGQGATVTLSGTGTVNLATASSSFHGTSGASPTLVNQQTITGQGSLGLEGFSIVNQATINAAGGTLTVQTDSTGITNSSLMEASNGATLWLIAPVTNTGGTIEALNGGTVTLDGPVTGGTLTTAGTGVIQLTADSILNGVLNTGSVEVSSGNTGILQNTVTNPGTIQVASGTLFMAGNVTLTGSGSLLMSGSSNLEQNTTSVGPPGGSLTNQQLIHGAGTFYDLPLTNQATIEADNKSAPLYLETATTNTGTLEASGGATLQIDNGQTVNNNGGIIEALTGSKVLLIGTAAGGTLATSGTGVIESENGTLDGTVNVPSNTGKLTISGENDLTLQGTVNNTGTITLSGTACIALAEPTTLTGSGKIILGANNCIYGSGNSFTNQSTIEGAGSIGDSNEMPITNAGTILANKSTPLLIVPNASGFTNNGKLTVNAGSALTINSISGPFNNLVGGTLTGGTYAVTGMLGVGGAITANAASITLTGPSAVINTSAGTSALASFGANTTTGVLSLQKGQALTTATNFSNAGKSTVGASSSFIVGGSYTQTAGTTTVDGTLTAPTGLNLQKGTLEGKGTLVAAVTSSGTVVVGDATTKAGVITVTGSYSQQASGILDVAIGGTTVGSQYSQMAVSNGASLGGTLTIKVINSFVPTIGDTFTILSGSAVTGQFTKVNGSGINSGEHFEISYTPTAVILTVVSGE
jgi:fibronectin-binding autotransporter adhesin